MRQIHAALKKKKVRFGMGLVLVLLVYALFSIQDIAAPFNHVTGETNGEYGLAAYNLAQHGFLNLKFGLYTNGILEDPREAVGNYYTHHPSLSVYPVAILYKLFGVTELTTRIWPFLFTAAGIFFFALALRRIFNDDSLALLAALVYAILPGVIFYGKNLEVAVFSVPTALISFYFFAAYAQTGASRHFRLFLASTGIGGLLGWFYYAMPTGMWLVAWFLAPKQRNRLLVGIPIALAISALLTLTHFSILNGSIFPELFETFKARTSAIPIDIWMLRIASNIGLNATIVFSIAAFFGFWTLLYYSVLMRKKQHILLVPLVTMPVLIFIIFTQWSTHPYGVIYVLPAIAVSAATLVLAILNELAGRHRTAGALAGIILTVAFFGLGLRATQHNILYMRRGLAILGNQDIVALKKLATQTNDQKICIGQNGIGINLASLAEWYLRKPTLRSPECLRQDIDIAIVFTEALAEKFSLSPAIHAQERALFFERGFTEEQCHVFMCALKRPDETDR